MDNKLWYLKQCDIFQGLNKESMDRLERITRDKNVPKRQFIYSAEDRDDALYILKKGRVRIFKLLKLAEQFGSRGPSGTQITFKITHQELADMVGSSRETVTLILSEFRDDKVISINEKYITINDEETLRQWAGKE